MPIERWAPAGMLGLLGVQVLEAAPPSATTPCGGLRLHHRHCTQAQPFSKNLGGRAFHLDLRTCPGGQSRLYVPTSSSCFSSCHPNSSKPAACPNLATLHREHRSTFSKENQLQLFDLIEDVAGTLLLWPRLDQQGHYHLLWF